MDRRDGGLPASSDEGSDRRRCDRRWRATGAVGGIGIGLILASCAVSRVPLFVWNASASAPIGLYLVRPDTAPGRGELVVVRVPVRVQALAVRRRYLPANVPLVKHVGAIPGDTVCATGAVITVNGLLSARRRVRDGLQRPMPWWSGCHAVRRGDVLLLSGNIPDSFDGRYFGLSSAADIVGLARPLWVR
jgi:conjugative transfer signal peptidase TraF